MPEAIVKLSYPETARDAAVLYLGQLLIAFNEGQLIVSDPRFQPALDVLKSNAAVVMSDAKAPPLGNFQRSHLTIDQAAVDARKPSAGPLVEPAEAIAIALSLVRWTPGRLHGPEDRVVTLIVQAIQKAGWKFEPR